MKFIRAITLATFLTAKIQGADFQFFEKTQVIVCMDPRADFTIFGAQAIASRIYDGIGICIRWSRLTPACTVPRNSIVVSFLDETPPTQRPGSLAVSAPFQGRAILVYYDRVRAIGRSESSILLGYVLAHEIAHIAQGITRHSDEGILKSHWDGRDRSSMRRMALRFTEEDIDLIHWGLGGGDVFPQTKRRGSTVAIGSQ